MLCTTQMILDDLKDYGNPQCKLQRLVRDGAYTKVVRGLYETDPKTPGRYLASAIRSPSYLSFEYALRYYNMIPEMVRVFTSATFDTGKTKTYRNAFGTYTFRDSPKEAFYVGVHVIEESGRTYCIATREKAVCDELYLKSPVRSRKALKEMLYEDLRLEEDDILSLDRDMVRELSRRYHSTSVSALSDYLEEEKE